MSLAVFSAFFWTLAGIILFMFIFEEKLIALEDKLDAKRKERRNQKGKRRRLYRSPLAALTGVHKTWLKKRSRQAERKSGL